MLSASLGEFSKFPNKDRLLRIPLKMVTLVHDTDREQLASD